MKRLEVFPLPLDRRQVHHRVTPSIKFASTHLYTGVERGTVTINVLAREHNIRYLARVQTSIFQFPVSSQLKTVSMYSGILISKPAKIGLKNCIVLEIRGTCKIRAFD